MMKLMKLSNLGVLLSSRSRPTGGNPYRSSRRISLVFSLSSFVFLTACTDYVQQIEDRYGEWETSDEVSFSSSVKAVDPADVVVGSMTDSRDGQTYKTVSIGTQTWMAQNLNYETANSYCCSDTPSNCTKYGRLYTWAAAKTACQTGWHLPTKAEFETLFTAVGGSSTAGKMLKSTSGWNSGGDGTDNYSFSALPAGIRTFNEYYGYEGYYAYFWSSTEFNSFNAYDVYLGYGLDSACLNYDVNILGLSVRCVKD